MKQCLFIILFLFPKIGFEQTFFENAKTLNKKRTWLVSGINTFNWTASISGLYFVWYKDFPKTKFHTFNDAHEWQQMDKFGHINVAYQFAKASGDLYEWAGVNQKKASLIGGGYAFAYMFTFEMLDAYNQEWGFSFSDIIANTAGASLYSIQDFFWNTQFLKPKFSSHQTPLSNYRPEILGKTSIEKLLKDYNGQTYWLSFNPFLMINKNTKIPKWLNVSVGYGINNQLIGNGDTYYLIQQGQQISFSPYREFFISMDIDWEAIPVKNPYLKLLFKGLNIIKIPFPAVEFSKYGTKGHFLYF